MLTTSRKKILPLIFIFAAIVYFSWLVITSHKPVPSDLKTASGTIASISGTTSRGHITDIHIYIEESGKTFTYPDSLPNIGKLESIIKRGMPVEILYSDEDRPEVWGLKLGQEVFVSPIEAQISRQQEGYKFVAIAVALLALAMYIIFVKGRKQQT